MNQIRKRNDKTSQNKFVKINKMKIKLKLKLKINMDIIAINMDC